MFSLNSNRVMIVFLKQLLATTGPSDDHQEWFLKGEFLFKYDNL